jgi:hypothetical protein
MQGEKEKRRKGLKEESDVQGGEERRQEADVIQKCRRWCGWWRQGQEVSMVRQVCFKDKGRW